MKGSRCNGAGLSACKVVQRALQEVTVEQSQTPKTIVTRVQVQPGSRAVGVPHEVPTNAMLTMVGVADFKVHLGFVTMEVRGECEGYKDAFLTKVRPFADCRVGQRVMVETAIGWLDGVVQS